MKKQHKYIITTSFLLFFTLFLHAQNLRIDSYTVREKLVETWFTEDISVIRDKSSQILQTNIGDYFLVRAEENNGLMEIIVSPLVLQDFEVLEYNHLIENGQKTDTTRTTKIETWPKEALNSWILYRDSKTGKPVKIRQYIMPDSDVFMEFFYSEEKTKANFSIFGGLVTNQAPLVVPFEYFYTSSLKDIMAVTIRFPWEYTQSSTQIYTDTMHMISVIQKALPSLEESDILKNNAKLSFLKWIIDGTVKPLTGSIIFDDVLTTNTIETDLSYPTRKDSYSSYNFIRHLATASLSADTGILYTPNTANVDVCIEPFTFFVDNNDEKQRITYFENNGYKNQILKAVLYILATTKPQLFYLGAIRKPVQTEKNAQNTEFYSYDHAVAFFPWFDKEGFFRINVFQNGKELTFDDFLESYPDSFTHLVQIKSTMNFFPLISEND